MTARIHLKHHETEGHWKLMIIVSECDVLFRQYRTTEISVECAVKIESGD